MSLGGRTVRTVTRVTGGECRFGRVIQSADNFREAGSVESRRLVECQIGPFIRLRFPVVFSSSQGAPLIYKLELCLTR